MTDHPARFNDAILSRLRSVLADEPKPIRLLDPFAGTGRIYELATEEVSVYGIEIEPEWAAMHPCTQVGNALDLPFPASFFDVVATSPTYGNRMADHHNARDDSKRLTYRHRLGRELHPDNSGSLYWGPKYREFHHQAWAEATRVLRPGGLFVLNIKNFIRTKRVRKTKFTETVDVTQWHLDTFSALGYSVEQHLLVPVKGMRMGANNLSRVNHESVVALRRAKLK